jgi:uncharacterized membrane protein YdjX (TVP38/TMEM64 family)
LTVTSLTACARGGACSSLRLFALCCSVCRSLRLSPLIPGWLFSIAGPLLPMSAGRFGLVTLLACVPPSALTVQLGAVLGRMQVRPATRAPAQRLARGSGVARIAHRSHRARSMA